MPGDSVVRPAGSFGSGASGQSTAGSTALMQDAAEFHQVLTELVRIYMFRDRDRSSSHDVGVPGAHAVDILVRNGPMGLSQLATELFVDKSTASRIVSTLEERGYISRSVDPADRRFVRLEVTHAGRELHERIQANYIKDTAALLRSFDGEVRREITAGLRQVACTAAVHAGITHASICLLSTGDRPVPFNADLRVAGSFDLQDALAMLKSLDLPTAEIEKRFVGSFVVAREPEGEKLIGLAGVESHGKVGLLRSVAVRSSYQRAGLGSALVEAAIRLAKVLGIQDLYVLASIGEEFFLHHGWEKVERSELPSVLAASLQVQGVSSSAATTMRLRL